MRPEHHESLLVELESRVVSSLSRAAESKKGTQLDEILGDTLFQEKRRLQSERKGTKRAQADQAMWEVVRRGIGNASEQELRNMLERVVHAYGHEIAGNFDERVYSFSTRILPPLLGVLLNAVSPRKLLRNMLGGSSSAHALPHRSRLTEGLHVPSLSLPDLTHSVRMQGEMEHVLKLNEVGTLIFTPTHLSNLDSILLGWALYESGLPPVLYGAGLNLFANPVLGFFMGNLGAYTVDRRKKNWLYKEVLKNYTTLTLEYGYNNLFFPGGTRSRSGAVENHLKLGLLGTGISAYVNNLRNGKDRPKIFVVPCTLSYQLVLEAETLIDDWLQEAGKSRYIITDDEFSRPKRIADFVMHLFSLDSRIYVTLGRGYDVFGNPVDDDGTSRDPMGRAVDTAAYVTNGEGPVADPQRDAEYTREVGQRVRQAFYSDSVVYSTHALARVMFRLLLRHNPDLDLFRLLRTGGRDRNIELREVYRECSLLLEQLRNLEQQRRIRLDEDLAHADAESLVADGLRHFAIYHTQPAVQRKGDRLFARDRNLMLYYANRLDGYGLDGVDATAPGARRLN
ncbi:MAG: 1-acyl-sn-glycerol-3-phosphate acyltransferase [Pseudomonadota bacterium]